MTKIEKCRISGSKNLINVLSLGEQYLTGIFPKSKSEKITKGPLDLVLCPESGLLQLGHSYDLKEMYGLNYGYRSGLNKFMVNHLNNKITYLTKIKPLEKNDIVLDIGSNDGTLLNCYKESNLFKIGVDPTGDKFRNFYKKDVVLVSDFFNSSLFEKKFPGRKAKIISCISMFYDLESPANFVEQISEVLDKDGICHFEQSYMPTMLRQNAYDTICHEHLEFYSLGVVKKLIENAGLKIIDVQINGINGGSFAVTAACKNANFKTNDAIIDWMLEQEDRMKLNTTEPYIEFKKRVFSHRRDLINLINNLNNNNKKIIGYGASTKGNVLLQFCNFTDNDLSCIAEVNPDKYGSYTPGTLIPIVSEVDAKSMRPDYMLVLPWHFKDTIIKREENYLKNGGKLIFPLPEIEIV